MESSQCADDYTLGPLVQGCRGIFDFSVKFEKIILAIIPASIFIALSLARLKYLFPRPRIVRGFAFRVVKTAVITLLAVLQFSLVLILAIRNHGAVCQLSIAASALDFVATLAMAPLSSLEHSSSPHPSTLLNGYLLISTLGDILQTRTSWWTSNDSAQMASSRIMTAVIAVKALSLVLENLPKTRWIKWDVSEHSPEESSGIFSQAVYWWLNPLLYKGYTKLLSLDDLYALDPDMSTENVLSWKPDESGAEKKTGFPLAANLTRCLGLSFFFPVIPRLVQITFYYSQPLFTRLLLEHLERPKDPSTAAYGYALIGLGALIHIGSAISNSLYGYYVIRFKTTLRSCLGAVIYNKLSRSKPVAGSAGQAGGTEAVTLMNTDVERVCQGMALFHDAWAVPLEVSVGLWLLHRELGPAFVTSIVIAVVCSVSSMLIARDAKKYQRAVMTAMETRVTSTASVIENIRSLHMTGISGAITGLVHGLRIAEIAANVRWMFYTALTTWLGYVPLALTPVITLATTSKTLDVPTTFTALSYVSTLCHPLIILCQLLPGLQAAFICLLRIRDFLTTESYRDFRRIEPSKSDAVISIDGASFGWTSDRMALTDIKTTIPARKVTMITGPVASGKSTFCKALVGEVPVSTGNITLRTTTRGISFCDQNPFLTNTTVRETIIGYCRFDQQRFTEVIWATMLGKDIDAFADGHNTVIGPSGCRLSGGQKQRLSLARALYLDSDILIVDDILNSLDADTSSEVFDRVFGSRGVARTRGITAILCTNSTHHLPWADHVITLSADGTIASDGPTPGDGTPRFRNTKVQSSPRKEKDKPPFKPENSISQVSDVIEADNNLDRSRQKAEIGAYGFYSSKTGVWPLLLLLLAAVVFSSATNSSTYWVTQWSRDLLKRPRNFYLGIYALFQVTQLMLFFAGGLVAQLIVARRSGLAFHQAGITALTAAPLSYFTGTEKGVILSLFSKDMRVINEDIPGSTARALTKGVQVAGMMVIVAAGTPYLAGSYPILLGSLYLMQRTFLRTCRQMNLLDLELKGPLNTHFLDTISGMATIRAFGWVPQNVAHNNSLLDTSQRAAYLSAMLQQWLSLTLKMSGAGIAIAVITLATQMQANAALTGASLLTLTTFSTVLTAFIRSSSNLEIRMGSVNRLKKFCEEVQPRRESPNDFSPERDWPRSGAIELDQVSASYSFQKSDDRLPGGDRMLPPLALDNLSLSIRAGEKVAICGRTGSGKSSILLLLLRLLDPLPSCSTNVTIDGLPLHRIDGASLRRGIIAVPQDPVFLPAGTSIKTNLDPFDKASDEECMAALAAVHLSSLLVLSQGKGTSHAGGLYQQMHAESLSAGQQRLFALGRAVLRCRVRNCSLAAQGLGPGGVLLLDEVGFAADDNTERIIQEVVAVEFGAYTVIMVAHHQLRLVVDFFERVVVMEEGRVVEVGDPKVLKDVTGGRFAQLWDNTTEQTNGAGGIGGGSGGESNE